MGVTVKHTGNLERTFNFLKGALKGDWRKDLDSYGKKGVEALRRYTPVDTGKTAESWYYEVTENKKEGMVTIAWKNSNLGGKKGVKWAPIAILIQYGHAARNGSWIIGKDYINPAIRPIFDEMSKNAWMRMKAL